MKNKRKYKIQNTKQNTLKTTQRHQTVKQCSAQRINHNLNVCVSKVFT